MQGTFLHGLIMTAVVMLSGGLLDAIAQEVLAGESSSGQVSVSQKRKTEFYCAFSILGTIPKDGDLTVIGTTIFDTNVKGSAGAGLKAGIFPKFAGGVFSVAGKVFGHVGKLSGSQAQSDLTVINFMVNVLARYPGEIIQPYVRVGVDVSAGQLRDGKVLFF